MLSKYIRERQLKYKLKRVKNEELTDKKIEGANQIYELFKDLQNEVKEKLIVIVLDENDKIILFEVVAIGGLEAIITTPVDVFRASIIVKGNSIILAHNHTDGSTTPSDEDKDFTKKVNKISKLMGIELCDHIIIGYDDYYSFKENGKI